MWSRAIHRRSVNLFQKKLLFIAKCFELNKIDKNSIFQALILSYTPFWVTWFWVTRLGDGQVMWLMFFELDDFCSLKEIVSVGNFEKKCRNFPTFQSAKFAQRVENFDGYFGILLSKNRDFWIAIWMAELQFRNFQIRKLATLNWILQCLFREIRTFKLETLRLTNLNLRFWRTHSKPRSNHSSRVALMR